MVYFYAGTLCYYIIIAQRSRGSREMLLNRVLLYPEKFPDTGVYPFNLKVLQKTGAIPFIRPVTFLMGDNGTGKSTLLKAICRKCDIHIWQDTERSRYQYNRYEDELYKYIQVEWADGPVPGSYFASQIFQDFARFLDEWAKADPGILEYFGGRSLMTQSHGQSLISFFEARYKIKGIYFLDEPETALSPQSQLKLLRVLKIMSEAGHAQFIIATHSPILLAYPGATIYSFDSAPVKPISYEETEYYLIYRDFLNNRDRYLKDI
jgi:predicted ATPase